MTRALFDALCREDSTSRVVVDVDARVFDARTLLSQSSSRARLLLRDGRPLAGERVAIIVEPGAEWLTWVLAVWRVGGAAVPLLVDQPLPEIAHALAEARVETVVTTSRERARLAAVLAEARVLDAGVLDDRDRTTADDTSRAGPTIDGEQVALVLFTSGTTGKPKAAALSHRALDAQLRSLAAAWAWGPRDHALLVLPLHHVHGIVNVLFSSIAAGATVTMLHPFDARRTLDRLVVGDVNVFMAVPTIYKRLLDATATRTDDERAAIARAFSTMRLVVSGSAALDVPTFERIREVFGVTPLERYGMTEIGMALSNPRQGERVAGTVGFPLPFVDVRLVDESGVPLTGGVVDDETVEGDIEVRGPTLFSGYLFRDDVTRASFTDDGWFRTGDFARRRAGRYAILGRRSSDILKTGGEKVSALEIEGAVLARFAVRACAVIGLPHDEWGQEVCAVVEVAPGVAPPTRSALRATLKDVLAPFKVPRRVFVTDTLPVNALGKVQKSVVVARARAARDDDTVAAEGMREVRA